MWHDVEQNTDEWFSLRAGKVTGSAIAKVMANYGKAFGDPAKKLAHDLALEQATGKPLLIQGYKNHHMDRGHEEEPIARRLYEDFYFCDVFNGGFYDNGKTGASPDGNIGDDGVLEIKSQLPHVHYECIRKNSFPSQYKWQIVFELRESSREWLDFVSYCSHYPAEKRLFVKRVFVQEFSEEVAKIEMRLAKFDELVSTIKKRINEP